MIDALPTLEHLGAGPVVTLLAPVRRPTEQELATLAWRDLLTRARLALTDAGAGTEMLAPAVARTADWPRGGGSLAFVAGADGHRWFTLPGEVEPFVAVGDAPAFSALLPAVHRAPFVLLVLDLHDTRAFAVAGGVPRPVAVRGLPGRLEAAVPERERGQHLTRHGGSHVGGSGIASTLHGQVEPGAERDHDLDEFCRAVGHALWSWLPPEDPRPVVLAGVTDLLARFTKVADPRGRCEVFVEGSAARVPPGELATKAADALASHGEEGTAAVLERYLGLLGSGLASGDVEEIAAAASEGRVEVLLVPDRPATDPGVERAIGAALTHGSRVVLVPAGELDGVGALYRW